MYIWLDLVFMIETLNATKNKDKQLSGLYPGVRDQLPTLYSDPQGREKQRQQWKQ